MEAFLHMCQGCGSTDVKVISVRSAEYSGPCGDSFCYSSCDSPSCKSVQAIFCQDCLEEFKTTPIEKFFKKRKNPHIGPTLDVEEMMKTGAVQSLEDTKRELTEELERFRTLLQIKTEEANDQRQLKKQKASELSDALRVLRELVMAVDGLLMHDDEAIALQVGRRDPNPEVLSMARKWVSRIRKARKLVPQKLLKPWKES